MPKFAVISPTHIEGKKKEAWENFRDGGYIAIGSVVCQDLSGKSIDEIRRIVEFEETKAENNNPEYKRPKDMVGAYEQFFSLAIGDYVAVNNVSDGLFGIGEIISPYRFKEHAHNTGSTDPKDFYCHFRDVKWLVTSYMKRSDILKVTNERWWDPYGIITVYPKIPEYIKRIIRDIETGRKK